ncbi:DUF4062 domain-containing protein [Cupriavidus pauculus]|uniref:DUF4062 domain-containing protein n=1 Tax=Cupriavidus pauculus TaxID=82633 RepID=A0A2N5C6Q6_9BURK|nr:DUF4062 domain-containing protein [Cupriavidus pauculus]PLP97911.1 hypothetical protein CYJ10_24215 [Cupriavidus pauculus]
MEIKHQVFVSSTFKDLIEERKAVIHALLELDCIPAGMELFPATDEDAWSLIKEVIEGCDYYVLIIAGKYGSVGPGGSGYTEMEFDYAVSIGKPVICFLHSDLTSLKASNVEKTEELQQKLENFRSKAQAKHCKFWSTAEDLGGKVSRSLVQLRKQHPSPGWVPGRYAITESTLRELQDLRAKVAQFELGAVLDANSPPSGSETLEQGDDTIAVSTELKADKEGSKKRLNLAPSWDRIFSYCGPSMAAECSDTELMSKVKLAFWHEVPTEYTKFNSLTDIIVPYVIQDQIRVQLQALGLIAPGAKKRAVSDANVYWRLTNFGQKHLINIRARRRKTE